MILSNLWRVFYLIIIPVLRGFVLALQKDLFAWASGAWIDILIFVIMITIAVLQWYFQTYHYDSRVIYIRSGVFIRRNTVIFWKNISAISMIESFYLRPFRACFFRADTMGGSFKSSDLSIFLRPDKARAIMDFSGKRAADPVKNHYIPRRRSILALSVLTSNSFAGIVFISTFVSQSGKLLGNEFSDMIIFTFEDLARKLAFGIPPATAAIAYVLLGGWLIGFCSTMLNYRRFVLKKRNNTISIQSGLVTRREYSLNIRQINFIDIRQSVVAKILKLFSLYISIVGYGKHKDDITCVIPTEKEKTFTANRTLLFPDFVLSPPDLKSPKDGILRFIGQPLTVCICIPAAMGILIFLFSSWLSFVLYTGLMLMVPCVFFLVVRIIAFRTGGISKQGAYYTICYSSGFSLHTVVIPGDKIVSVRFRRSLFQVYGNSKTCDLFINTVAEGTKQHLCRNVNLEAATKLFADIDTVS
jgi:uncharacterized membrane protein YdbT with pleckstrin-like domain